MVACGIRFLHNASMPESRKTWSTFHELESDLADGRWRIITDGGISRDTLPDPVTQIRNFRQRRRLCLSKLAAKSSSFRQAGEVSGQSRSLSGAGSREPRCGKPAGLRAGDLVFCLSRIVRLSGRREGSCLAGSGCCGLETPVPLLATKAPSVSSCRATCDAN